MNKQCISPENGKHMKQQALSVIDQLWNPQFNNCLVLLPCSHILQIDGFLFLLIGSALYNEIIDLPCSSASTTETVEVQETPSTPKDDGKLGRYGYCLYQSS